MLLTAYMTFAIKISPPTPDFGVDVFGEDAHIKVTDIPDAGCDHSFAWST